MLIDHILCSLLQEVSLSGWKITHKSGDAETEYKFHRTVKLGGGDVVTVSEYNLTSAT